MNTVEILIRVRDEATKGLTQAIASLERGGAAAVRTSGNLDKSLTSSTRSARAFGVVLLSNLSPQLAQVVQNLRLATEGARLAGTGFGQVAGVVGGIAVAAFAAYVASAVEATKRQAELNLAVRSFDASRLRSELRSIASELETNRLNWQKVNKEITGFQGLMQNIAGALSLSASAIGNLFRGAPEGRAKAINEQLKIAAGPEHRLALLEQTKAWIDLSSGITVAQIKAEGFVDEQDRVERVLRAAIEQQKNVEIQTINTQEKIAVGRARAAKDAEAEAEAAKKSAGDRVNAELKAEQAVEQIKAAAAERKRLFLQTGVSEERIIEQRRHAGRLALLQEALDGERQILLRHADLMARHGRDSGEQFAGGVAVGLMALQDQVGTFGQSVATALHSIGSTWFRGIDDTFFSAMTGRFKDLPDIAKRMGEDILRELIGVFTGPMKRNVVEAIAGLFGARARPGFSPAALGALIPGAPGSPGLQTPLSLAGLDVSTRGAFSDRLVFGPSPEEIAEMARAGVPLPGGLTFGQFAGGAGMAGLGALGILAAGRAQTPLSGGIAGGLGGYALGSGLGTLFQAGSYIPYIGAVFAVAGLAYGLISGGRASSKRKREEARQRRAQAQILLVEGADTLEELEALSTGIPVPSRRFGTIIQALEPEAMAALRQRATGLILQAGQEEIAATGSLAGIRAILARGVSPDVGGVELQAAAQARELEILRGLEAIGGISIEEQLEGGIRRRTVVGAGAFGRARAREASGKIIVGATEFRRMLRDTRQSAPELFDELLRYLLDRAGARGIRLEAARL